MRALNQVMFDGLKPEVEALLKAAANDLPTAEADAGLLAAMSQAVSAAPLVTQSPNTPRRISVLGKLVTAKAAVLGGALFLSAGVASAAATGNLPAPAQDASSSVANVVGLDIPKSDKKAKKEHPENHGKDVSSTARDKSTTTEGVNHGSVVCEVASEGKCKPDVDETKADADSSGQGNSAEQRKDGSHRNENSVKTTTTSTTTDEAGATSDEGKTRGQSEQRKPSKP